VQTPTKIPSKANNTICTIGSSTNDGLVLNIWPFIFLPGSNYKISTHFAVAKHYRARLVASTRHTYLGGMASLLLYPAAAAVLETLFLRVSPVERYKLDRISAEMADDT
jgi:hypothetical protein